MINKKYEIIDILHSGRKDIRNTKRTDDKFDGMIGSIITIDRVEAFKPLHFRFVDSTDSYRWTTTALIALYQDTRMDDDIYYFETVNTIYVLRELQ